MSVLRTGEYYRREVGWISMGILLCDECGRRMAATMDDIEELIVFGAWVGMRLRNADGTRAIAHRCPACCWNAEAFSKEDEITNRERVGP